MTQKIKVTGPTSEELYLVLKDDGRVFHEGTSIASTQEKAKEENSLLYIMFAILQTEVVILFFLSVLEVI